MDKFLYQEQIRCQIRKKLNLSDKTVIGHVGRFSYPKNHHFLISIFNEIYKGDKTRKEFFNEILDVLTLLGGDLSDVK